MTFWLFLAMRAPIRLPLVCQAFKRAFGVIHSRCCARRRRPRRWMGAPFISALCIAHTPSLPPTPWDVTLLSVSVYVFVSKHECASGPACGGVVAGGERRTRCKKIIVKFLSCVPWFEPFGNKLWVARCAATARAWVQTPDTRVRTQVWSTFLSTGRVVFLVFFYFLVSLAWVFNAFMCAHVLRVYWCVHCEYCKRSCKFFRKFLHRVYFWVRVRHFRLVEMRF